jgi:transcriptional regulator with XRE-family HTH domain
MSANPISKRRQFGEALAFLRGEAGLSKHNLADKTRTTTKIVDTWETGESAPTAPEWQRMRAIFPAFSSAGSRYAELYRAAAAEQLAVEQARVSKSDERDDLTAAVRLVVEAMPGLRTMTIDVDDDGEIAIAYKTREVRVVEDSGSLKVRR